MRRVMGLVLVSILVFPITSVAEGGVNEEPSLEGTDIESILFQDEASAGKSFGVTVFLTDEASSDVTAVDWVTQVCINSGICYPPEAHSMADQGSGEWSGSIIPDSTVTYVNWRIDLHYEGGDSNSVPESGFGWKVWSDCWYDNGTWGGSTDACQEERGNVLPGFSFPLASVCVAMAALMARRD